MQRVPSQLDDWPCIALICGAPRGNSGGSRYVNSRSRRHRSCARSLRWRLAAISLGRAFLEREFALFWPRKRNKMAFSAIFSFDCVVKRCPMALSEPTAASRRPRSTWPRSTPAGSLKSPSRREPRSRRDKSSPASRRRNMKPSSGRRKRTWSAPTSPCNRPRPILNRRQSALDFAKSEFDRGAGDYKKGAITIERFRIAPTQFRNRGRGL